MKKTTCDKVKFMLWGITGRYAEKKDYFVKMTLEFKSGTKTFCGEVLPSENGFAVSLNGVNSTVEANAVSDLIAGECAKYEALVFTYVERGTNLILEADDRNVRTRQTDNSITAEMNTKAPGSREYIIKPGRADALLKEIGIMTKDGKIKNDKIRKYNQIDHYIEILQPVIEALPKNRRVCILDCACGKSYLSFVLNYYMRDMLKMDCRFIGVDYSETVIEASKRMAKNLGYHNMEFVCADVRVYEPTETIDLLISLHACDTATDMAIGLGIRTGVKAMVVVPCCHKEMLSQYHYDAFAPLLKHPIFKARLADVLTDAMRCLYMEACGYEITAMEYISPLETPKNLMIKAVKTGDENYKAMSEYQAIRNALGVRLSVEDYSVHIDE